jgi:hypothetical protein
MTTSIASERLGGALAFAGAAVLLASTLLHPAGADPGDAPAAFAEYAASGIWVGVHLGQFVGVVLLAATLVALAATLEPGYPAAIGMIASAGAAAMIAVAAALQAVDGVALKIAVDRWTTVAPDARALAFETAFAIRQIEIGLAALLSVLAGLTLSVVSVAMLAGHRYPRWFAALGTLGGVGTLAAGYGFATAGFAAGPMAASMLGNVLLLGWALAAGTLMLTKPSRPEAGAT